MNFLRKNNYNKLIEESYNSLSKELAMKYTLIRCSVLRYKSGITMPINEENYACGYGIENFYGFTNSPIIKNGRKVPDIEKVPDDLFFKQLFTDFLNNLESFFFDALFNKSTAGRQVYIINKKSPPSISYEDALSYLDTNSNSVIVIGSEVEIPMEYENRVLKVSGSYEARDRITGSMNIFNFIDPLSFILIKDVNHPILNFCWEKTDEQKLSELLLEDDIYIRLELAKIFSSNKNEEPKAYPYGYFTYDTNPAKIVGWVVAKLSYEVLHDNYFVGTIN